MPETISGESPDSGTSPDRLNGGGACCFSALLGLWLVLGGAAALIASGSFDERPPRSPSPARDAPVNESARSEEDISAHNSPSLVRNPPSARRTSRSRAGSTRRSSPARCTYPPTPAPPGRQTAIPAPKGEEAKCFRPDLAFAADGTLYLAFVTPEGPRQHPQRPLALEIRRRRPDAVGSRSGCTAGSPSRLGSPPIPRTRSLMFLTWLQGEEVGVFKFTKPGEPDPRVAAPTTPARRGRRLHASTPGPAAAS